MATQVTPGRRGPARTPRAVAIGAGQTRIFAVFALAAVLILTVATLVIPRAYAYIPVELPEAAVGSQPKLKATMTYSPKTPAPTKGSKITYNAHYTSDAVSDANPQSVITITVSQDPKAPFDSAPTSTDLKITGGEGKVTGPVALDENTWAYTINTSNLAGFDATFEKGATVKEDLDDGTVVVASTSFDFKPGTNKVGMTEVTKEVVGTGGDICTGYAKYTSKIPADALGAWLADMKYAVNPSVATLDELPDNIGELLDAASDPQARNSIKFTFPEGQENAPDGTPWIDKIRAGAVIRKQDGTKPLYGTDPILQKPGVEFKDSINWKYDPAIWTGVDSWLPTGTVLEVHRGYKYRSCDNNVATDGNPSRLDAFGIQYDMGSAKLIDTVNATAAFRTPGGLKGDWCSDIGYIHAPKMGLTSKSPTGKGNQFGLYNFADKTATNLVVPNPEPTFGSAVGMTSKYRDRLYYLSGDPTSPQMYYVSSATETFGEVTKVELTNTDVMQKLYTTTKLGLAIDENGIAYIWNQAKRALYKVDINDGAAHNVELIGKVPEGVLTSPSLDIGSLGNGRLLLVTLGKQLTAYEVDPAAVAGGQIVIGAGLKQVLTATKPPEVSSGNGLAFASDGYAYIGEQLSQGLFRFQLTQGAPEGGELQYLSSSQVVRVPRDQTDSIMYGGKFIDLGSCYYPRIPEKGFQVQKSAVDPKTGAVVEAGKAATNSVKVGPDGRATVKYAVQVTNVSSAAAAAPSVTDTFSAPAGFTVESMTVTDPEGVTTEPVKGNEVTIEPGQIDGNSVKSFIVTVKVKADSFEAIDGAKGECDEMGNGASAGGFFNLVAMDGDKDGSKNNEACVPFEKPKTAKIKLIKKIVDQSGKAYGDPGADFPSSYVPATELANFTLAATGRESDDGAFTNSPVSEAGQPGGMVTNPPATTSAPLSAVSGTAGADGVAVEMTKVQVGTYTLGEDMTGTPNPEIGTYLEGKPELQDGNFVLKQGWECTGSGTAKLDDGRPRVTLAEGQEATCTVTNTFVRKNVHIEKQANSPTEASKHVGVDVELTAPEGNPAGPATGNLVYKVIVTNDSVTSADSGKVTDKFVMPAGLVSNGDVTVKFISSNGNAVRVDGKDSYNISEFAGPDGATLATSVKNLGPAGSSSATAVFEITIPVKEDQSPGEGNKTKFQNAKETLAQCDETTAVDGDQVLPDEKTKGAVNEVALVNEYPGYTATESKVTQDNFACIPVTRTEIPAEWQVKKGPKNPTDLEGKDPSKVGATVTMTEVNGESPETSGYEAVAEYTVTVTNVGQAASNAPAVTDTPKLPAGFTITKVEYDTGKGMTTVEPVPTGAFTIPGGSEPVEAGSALTYTVKVTGFITKEAAAKAKWETTIGSTGNDKEYGLGECADKDGTLGGGTGFYNKVTIEDDKDGEDNNESCVPVVPPSARVLIEKTDAKGTPLTGAEFTIYKSEQADGVHFTQGAAVEGAAPVPALTEELIPDLPGGALEPGDKNLTGRYITPKLEVGKVYFLKETKSPAADEVSGFTLLPQAVMFKVTGAGKVVPVNNLGDEIGTDQDGVKVVDDSFYLTSGKITVHDPRAGELPKAGGLGHWTLAGGAGLLIMVSLMFLFRTNPNRRRA